MKVTSLSLLCLALTGTASLIPRTDPDPTRYTICGADRGYTEADSLAAKEYLITKIVRSDRHPLLTNECAFAHVNTTIVSVCNGPARNRTVNQDEVRRGVDQLIKDCGLQGGFTGIHVVNNLTFSAYGITGAKRLQSGAGTIRKSQSKSKTRATTATGKLAKRDCQIQYDGKAREDCDKVNTLNDDGVCEGSFDPNNNCEAFCELTRTGLYGPEERPSGRSGERTAPGIKATIVESTEFSVSNGFSIGVDGVSKDAIGAGVSYSWSSTITKGNAIERTAEDVSDKYWSRWIFLPKLIMSCGTIGRKTYRAPQPCMGDICRKQFDYGCVDEIETITDVCSIVPKLNDQDEPEVDWAVRYENDDGTPAPFDEQPISYQHVCRGGDDPDNDGETECMTDMPAKRNFVLEDSLASGAV
ncbi:hypothetical protein QBC44DRAFT_245859 [Cladorrhinum sp. PSN332]|nr:hypothetical protein QBC44DRAFT_245859 [Cladorrhinum sp. PSN332]